jgi:Tol biopolymer transport system component
MINRLPRIILLLLILASLECAGKAEKRIPPNLKHKIVFLCSGAICTINPDGTDLKVIVPSDTAGPFSNPQWSPDKRRIAFNCKVEKRNRIMMANFDGSDLKILGFSKLERKKKKPGILRLERWGDLYFEGWSPDGKYILFYHPVIDGSFVGLMNRNGKIRGELGGSHPDFLGRDKIVCVGHHGSVIAVGTDIYCAPIKGRGKQNLTRDGKLSYYGPVGSPDGERIAFGFMGPRTENNGLWIMNADGSNRRRLTCNGEDFRDQYSTVISFSPDGNKILFLSAPYDSYKARAYPVGSIYIANGDGNELKKMTDEIVKSREGASWSPDGKQIVFTSGKDRNDELYTVNADGTDLRRLTNNSTPDCCPDW